MGSAKCPLKVSVGDLEIVVLCYGSRIADAHKRAVQLEVFGPVGVPREQVGTFGGHMGMGFGFVH